MSPIERYSCELMQKWVKQTNPITHLLTCDISPVVSFQTEILSDDSVYRDLDPLASVWVSAFDIALHM